MGGAIMGNDLRERGLGSKKQGFIDISNLEFGTLLLEHNGINITTTDLASVLPEKLYGSLNLSDYSYNLSNYQPNAGKFIVGNYDTLQPIATLISPLYSGYTLFSLWDSGSVIVYTIANRSYVYTIWRSKGTWSVIKTVSNLRMTKIIGEDSNYYYYYGNTSSANNYYTVSKVDKLTYVSTILYQYSLYTGFYKLTGTDYFIYYDTSAGTGSNVTNFIILNHLGVKIADNFNFSSVFPSGDLDLIKFAVNVGPDFGEHKILYRITWERKGSNSYWTYYDYFVSYYNKTTLQLIKKERIGIDVANENQINLIGLHDDGKRMYARKTTPVYSIKLDSNGMFIITNGDMVEPLSLNLVANQDISMLQHRNGGVDAVTSFPFIGQPSTQVARKVSSGSNIKK